MVGGSGSSLRPAKVRPFGWSFLHAPSFVRARRDHVLQLSLLNGSAYMGLPHEKNEFLLRIALCRAAAIASQPRWCRRINRDINPSPPKHPTRGIFDQPCVNETCGQTCKPTSSLATAPHSLPSG